MRKAEISKTTLAILSANFISQETVLCICLFPKTKPIPKGFVLSSLSSKQLDTNLVVAESQV